MVIGMCPGRWCMTADEWPTYELTSVPARFQQEGLRVRFTLRVRDDLSSNCMVGPVADLISLQRVDQVGISGSRRSSR
jgi:hypothetical protein